MMARKKKTTIEAGPIPAQPAPASPPPGIGVCVSRSRGKSLRANARLAGSKSPLFPKGGSAFSSWCATKGIHTLDHRPIEEWNDLLREFASRPVHGLRRGPEGGDHRPSPSARR